MMDDILAEFLAECEEGITQLDQELVELEQNPGDTERVASIFRVMHTIKGTSGFLGLARLERVTHAAETVMGAVRDGTLRVSAEIITALFEALDCIKTIISGLAESQQEPDGDDEELVSRLLAIASGETASSSAQPSGEPAAASEAEETPDPEAAAPCETGEGEQVAEGAVAESADAPESPSEPGGATDGPTAKPEPSAASRANEANREKKAPAARSASAKAPKTGSATTLRVSVSLLEYLMSCVSELVLTRNQLIRIARDIGKVELDSAMQRLDNITTSLREGVMKARMQPISHAWSGLPRLVRELSGSLGKQVDLQMEGGNTELDRQLLEFIRDPLTHMVRNAIDHGIEPPEVRRQSGKPERAVLRLAACHEGGSVVIRIIDDGRGLDPERIGRKAIEKGIISEADLEAMTPQQIMGLIFAPGFSTAEKVTNVSGRGVGMDVVRTNVEKIGGSIQVESRLGEGTTFTILIPLTLAIMPALIVSVCGHRLAVPQLGIQELVHCGKDSDRKIATVDGCPILHLRDQVLPVLSMREVLGLEEAEAALQSEGYVLVLETAGVPYGVLVDSVLDSEEIVVEPIASVLKDLTLFAGATILGDGHVAMVLDTKGLSSRLEAVQAGNRSLQPTTAVGRRDNRTSLLRFRAGKGALKAVPLALISRIECIEAGQAENCMGRTVVRFDRDLIPLVDMDGFTSDLETDGRLALIFTEADKRFGLLIDEIVDVIESEIRMSLKSDENLILGAAVLEGTSTELINVGNLVQTVFGGWITPPTESSLEELRRERRVLLIDDSAFFRGLLVPLLETNGFQVTAVDSATRAVELCESGEDFDLIISDIEMPEMDGFAFVSWVAESRWREVPVVALTSRTTPADVQKGRAAGFARYLGKLDQQELVAALHELTQQAA